MTTTATTTYVLCDSETTDVIRHATADEIRESYEAGPEGHIRTAVDGEERRCYVEER